MMHKCWTLALAALAACCGCTTSSLERYSLRQIDSSGDYRATAVLSCLATVAADPDNLPPYALLADGLTRTQDMGTLNSTTIVAREIAQFPLETLALTGSRSPQGQWTLSPVVDFERLRALRCACQWVVYGPDRACQDCGGILNSAEENSSDGAHFGVAERLAHLPRGWLHIGRLVDVPPCACHTAHCGATWVWVMPDGLPGLADFTLVLHDIATLDSSAYEARPLLVTLTREEFTQITDPAEPEKKVQVIRSQEIRKIKPKMKPTIERRIREGIQTGKVDISWAEWMEYTMPYHGTRASLNAAVAVGRPSPREAIPTREVQPVPGLSRPKPQPAREKKAEQLEQQKQGTRPGPTQAPPAANPG